MVQAFTSFHLVSLSHTSELCRQGGHLYGGGKKNCVLGATMEGFLWITFHADWGLIAVHGTVKPDSTSDFGEVCGGGQSLQEAGAVKPSMGSCVCLGHRGTQSPRSTQTCPSHCWLIIIGSLNSMLIWGVFYVNFCHLELSLFVLFWKFSFELILTTVNFILGSGLDLVLAC